MPRNTHVGSTGKVFRAGRAALALALLPGLVALGCDDDDKSSGADAAASDAAAGRPDAAPVLSSGVPGSTPLSMLTPAQARRLCEATTTFLEMSFAAAEPQQALCKITAALTVSGQPPEQQAAACQAARTQCLAVVAQGTGVDAGAGNDACDPGDAGAGGGVPSCDVTVAQYEACVGGIPGGLGTIAALVPECSALGMGDGGAAFSPLLLAAALPPACAVVLQMCGSGALPVLGM